MPQQVDDLQIPKQNIFPTLYIDTWMRKMRKSWVHKRKNQVRRLKKGPEALNGRQIRWGIVMEIKLTRVKFWIIVVIWLPLWEFSTPRITLLQPSPLLIGNYSAVTPTHWVVWWMVEANVDVPRVRPGRVQPAVFLTTLLVALLVAFFCRARGHSSYSTTTRSGKALVCK